MFASIEKAVSDLKAGKIIIICDDEGRENEGDFVCLAEKVTPEAVNFMITHGRGLLCMPLDQRIADALKFRPMVDENTDNHETAFTVSVDSRKARTGISAFERAETIQAIVADQAKASDFHHPGHIFPLIAREEGVLRRAGHTEASVDLARLAGAKPAAVICEILKGDGHMARRPELEALAQTFGLKMITVKDLITYRQRHHVHREVSADLPTALGSFHIIGYSDQGKEHVALVKGQVAGDQPVLVRVHSECLTGDVFGSERCDCGPQLHKALQMIEEAGKGVVIYLRQEGRGIGLINKLKAYRLQEKGDDTVEANLHLGFPPDMRDYAAAAEIIRDLGITKVRLMTNNPAKIKNLERHGLHVIQRVPLEINSNENNRRYLFTKAEKMGHLLHLSK
ncbi:bifunctional 3,4-dihydroxy-2-butanone-4-phosphate synthase/GTP cyclohydrolase II [Sporolactobacillus sp. THM19-2]|uniref:bifunctional 3,4-dihydroxy-2-butanone-4-phosphate synthase/GTP cyclohydrolase II n=1 Tax=Sporolactobacillus sp. THM19-2 TaxID=2511171 RepID=UPI0010204C89|nr:bifunctional 3,4-dihydroxy-2-butanone-4-phosphate synthase/GTP cyclohydrolase II [Sporolactobacillus sp. THM19-2]RYL92573.1 bifunctional 3,4-dihydroxy-2-butanone-4-phosphate synthase/GTP cyclohydrolase II [Sporolactobacillus sp. THM19-2]